MAIGQGMEPIDPLNIDPTGQVSLTTEPTLKAAPLDVNLTPYKPSTWDNKLVISSVTGTSTSTSPIFNTHTLYVDWAVVNTGTAAVSETFYSRLYVDDVLKGTWSTVSLRAGAWAYKTDINIGSLTPGTHSIRIQTDVTSVVAETNEADNSYTRTITVYPYVNLTTYQPAGWDNKIVLSTVTGTHTSDSQILSTENIYLDWSIINAGSYATTTTFYVDLYIDGVWKAAWNRAGLGASSFTSQSDYLIGKLTPGSHTILIRIDNDGYIKEYNETDNEYSRTITVYNKNLLLYQRSGWDNKLVLSTVTGTNTSAPAFYNNQDIYVDWSVWNNGTVAVPETFHSKLYVDGVQKGNWFTAGLAANYTAYIADHNIGKLAIGNHTIRIVIDADSEVDESNEADNSYSRTIYVGPSYNLTAFQPGGWDNKIVLSTVTGTNTSASQIFDNQNIYVDWAAINNALNDITTTFYIRLYVDGVSKGAWTKSTLNHNTYTWAADFNIGPLTAGSHTVRLVVDADGHIAESDETDNEYSRTFTVLNKNLLPYKPVGWDDKLVLSTVTGTNTSAAAICEGQNIYLDYSIFNNGNAAISETFYVRLYVDGVAKATWTKAGIGANTYYTIQDYSVGTLSAGTHTFKITADVLNNVDETSETDNEYTRTFSVSTCKNLTPHQPASWDNKLVLSTVKGTNTSDTSIKDNEPIYLDWAVISNGSNNITETFTTKLYVDGSLKSTWTRAGLTAGVYLYYSDFSVGTLPAGSHTFKIVTDADNNVVESNEGDNEYSRTITVQQTIPPAPVSTAATSVAANGFSANWNDAEGATGYFLDVSTTNTFSSFVTGYNNKSVGDVITSAVSGLASGTTYYYRVRANNAAGTSVNSNVIIVTTGLNPPGVPVATAASLVTPTGFYANWNSVANAMEYYIDVSVSSTFSSFVTGYKNKSVGNVLTSAVTGLSSGTIYYYRVRAANAGGTSSNSNVIKVTTGLKSPNAPVATEATSVTATGFTANWDASDEATGYFIDVSTTKTFSSLVPGYNNKSVGNVLSSAVTGLTAGTTYYYRVRAANAGGTSENSNIITIATGIMVPDAPMAAGATSVTQTSFYAGWSTVAGATGYYLDVSTNSAFSSFLPDYNNKDVGNQVSYHVIELTPGTTYYYRLRAYNAGGTSGNSNIIMVTTGLNPPDAPLATEATSITATGFSANWNASGEATGYYLDVSTSNTFSSFVTGYSNKSVGNVLSSAVSGLAAGTTYYYRIRAANAGGTSSHSNIISLTTTLEVPGAPVATAATSVTTTGFSANWNSVTGAAEYYLDVSSTNEFTSFISGYGNLSVGNVLTSTVSGLISGATYYYRVRASNAGGTSSHSNIISITTAIAVPDAPVATEATSVTFTGFTANWNAVAGTTEYFLDVSTTIDFSSFLTGFTNKSMGSLLTSPVSGLTSGTTYYYRVRAANAGGTSTHSNIITVTTEMIVPDAPVAKAAIGITKTSFFASWNAVAGAAGYKIDVSTSNSFDSFVTGYNDKDVGSLLTTQIAGLTAQTIYYYRLRAYNAGGTSGNSNIITVTTGMEVPAAPVATAATSVTQNGFQANWNASSGVSQYYLDVSTSNTFSSFLTGYNNKNAGNELSASVTGLAAGATCYYRVRAANSTGTSGNSNVITVTLGLNPPGAPVATPATSKTNTGFAANWNASTGAAGYFLDVSTSNTFSSFVPGYEGYDAGDVLTSHVSGLTHCTSYYFRIRAYNSGGTSTNSNTIGVTYSNIAPTLVKKIPDQTVLSNQTIAVLISNTNGQLFSDEDADDVLTVTVKKENGESLPSYITQVEDYLIINPALADTGCYNIVVNASDMCNAFVTDTFSLCVKSHITSIHLTDGRHFNLKMYPNPTTGLVYIESDAMLAKVWISVYSVHGSTVFLKEYFPDETIVFDMSGHPPGLYLVRINTGDWETIRKLMLDKRE